MVKEFIHLIQLPKQFIALKAEVNKLENVNVQTSLNNLRTKVNNLVLGKLKTVSVDFKNVMQQITTLLKIKI